MKPPEKNYIYMAGGCHTYKCKHEKYYITLVLMSILINHSNNQCRVIYLEYESQIIKKKFIISIS